MSSFRSCLARRSSPTAPDARLPLPDSYDLIASAPGIKQLLESPLGICPAPRACYFVAMSTFRIIFAAWFLPMAIAAAALTSAATPAAAGTCIFDWAVPGPYDVSGNFRGRTDTVMARLTNDCRVTIGLPGVFTGAPVRQAGNCLAFSFRVQDVRQTFNARWCESYGVVPWEGRDVRATIVPRHGLRDRHTR
jgi:hypothetical protein